ncbi:MAG: tetratricopeptide repeat protein [Deltaproteobacteria bacterium]
MYFRFFITLILLFGLSGCVKFSGGYITGTAYQRAVMLFERGELAEAKVMAESVPAESTEYRSARKLIKDIAAVTIQVARRHMELGDEYEKAGIYKKAMEEYKRSLELNPNPLVALRLDDLFYIMKNGNKSEPEKSARLKKEEDSEYAASLHYMKGKLYMDSKAYGKAIEEFNAVFKRVPTYMDAKELLAKAKKERDRAVDFHLKKGIGFFQEEEMEKAIMEWEAVLELDPANKTAADYKDRAEVILERLRSIRQKKDGPTKEQRL